MRALVHLDTPRVCDLAGFERPQPQRCPSFVDVVGVFEGEQAIRAVAAEPLGSVQLASVFTATNTVVQMHQVDRIAVGLAVWLVLAYGNGSNADRNQLEAIKTAGTIVVGTGGGGALWLAARRQRTTEIALRQKDLDQFHADRAHALQERTAAATQQDAAERRVADLYTKAADQLGSEKAPVRLAGMYALERLAQNNRDQRQTIVNVLCAYLRMPYTPPDPPAIKAFPIALNRANAPKGNQATETTSSDEQQDKNERREQERQVRLTAQRILATHLRPGSDPTTPVETFWANLDLDLTAATLLNLDLTDCHIRTADFSQTRCVGTTKFQGAHLEVDALFECAHFDGIAWFEGAHFNEDAWFNLAKFSGDAGFEGTLFAGDARFDMTKFSDDAEFCDAQFCGDAIFRSSKFDVARFDGAQFAGDVMFNEVQFRDIAVFDGARFAGDARFDGAQFEEAIFDRAQFAEEARFEGARFAGDARFGRVQFSGDPRFDGAYVQTDVPDSVMRVWPRGYSVVAPATPEDGDEGHLEDEDGLWGQLIKDQQPASGDPES